MQHPTQAHPGQGGPAAPCAGRMLAPCLQIPEEGCSAAPAGGCRSGPPPPGAAAGCRCGGPPREQDATDSSVLGWGGSGSDPLPAALAPGERTRLWAPALCGDSALIPGGAGAVLVLPVAMGAALVRAIGELAEFVLQVRDALLLRLDRLLQGTDLLQHLLQGWPLSGGDTRGHRRAPPAPPTPPQAGGQPCPHVPIPRTLTENSGSQPVWLRRRPGGGLLSRMFFLTTFSSRFLTGT